MTKTLGITFWTLSLLTLMFQGGYWVLHATWPSVTIMDVMQKTVGSDLFSALQALPFEIAFKTTYVLVTTELALALWWAGVTCFLLTVLGKFVFGR